MVTSNWLVAQSTSEYFDSYIKLIYLRSRWYDPYHNLDYLTPI